jgi:hypothetical protein
LQWSVNLKSVREVFHLAPVKRDHIEAEVTTGDAVFHNVSLGCGCEIPHLLFIYPFGWMPEGAGESRFDFDEHNKVVPPRDQVDFLMTGAPVALNNLETVVFVESRGTGFERLPDMLFTPGGIRIL